jgi:prepilin-type N-terminal cleavage/methylation domain-containing protein
LLVDYTYAKIRQKDEINMNLKKQFAHGFTIIELLVVIVIIGILTAIVYVGYDNIQAKTLDTSVLSDLDTMDALQTDYGLSNNTVGKVYNSSSGYDGGLDFAPSSGNIISVITNEDDYCIRGYNSNGTKNSIDNAYKKESSDGACDRILGIALNCPTGFIPVPGSSTYSTSDFCVMKYEAKQASATVPTSTAGSAPWTSISRDNAMAYSQNVAGCPSCHLITEAEWMTIAQNVLGVSSNWTTGTVNSGQIYRGHTDNSPNSPQVANAVDGADDWYLTGQTTGGQRRTLTLSNGAVIWDFAGNVSEFTQEIIVANGQPGYASDTDFAYREWTDASMDWRTFPASSRPASTGITGASGWTSANGIGKIYSNFTEVHDSFYARGGDHTSWSGGGVLAVKLSYDGASTSTYGGFRVAMTP